MRTRALAVIALSAGLLLGCSKARNRTAILIEVRGDLAVPSVIDTVRLEISGASSDAASPDAGEGERFDLRTDPPKNDLYATAAVHPVSGSSGTFVVTAIGLLGDSEKVRQSAVVNYVSDDARLLVLYLSSSCMGGAAPSCSAAKPVCDKGGCTTADVIGGRLVPIGQDASVVDAPGQDSPQGSGGKGGGAGAGGNGGSGSGGGSGGGAGGVAGTTDAGTPQCDAQSAAQCTDPSTRRVCSSGNWTDVTCPAATPACVAGGCVKCTEHSQCPGSACHLSGTKVGTCFDLSRVVTAATYADVTSAMSGLSATGELVILLQGSINSTQQISVGGSQEVAIIGRKGQTWTGSVPGDSRNTLIYVSSGGILYLSSIRLDDSTATCTGVGAQSGSTLWVDDCFISGYASAVSSAATEVHVRRSFLRGSTTAPIYMSAGSLFMHTTVLAPLTSADASSALGAIMFSSLSGIVVDIRYSTIIGGQHAIACNPAPQQSGSIRNSILLDHTSTDGPLPDACNTLNLAGNYAPNTYYPTSWFVNADNGDFHLSAAGAAAVSQTAQLGAGDPTVDIDGTARPATGYPGIDQP